MEFRVLGPLEVDDNGRQVALGGPKSRALLAILLLRRGEVVPTEELIEQLYDGLPPEKAANSVQAQVSRLRKTLAEGRLRTAGRGYVIDILAGELDLDRFEELLERGRAELGAGDPKEAASSFRQALALWRGPPLADFRYSDFAQGAIARLEDRRVVAFEDRIDADLALGLHADLVSELEALVVEFPLRERLRRQLMLAFYRSGRQAEALEAYQDTRRALTGELGIEPSPELRELQRRILEQDPSLQPVRGREALAERDESQGAFVGREVELQALHIGLDDAIHGRGRLFLVVGEPGIGKSRLADELAREARARGANVIVGRAWEAGGAPAYWPWVQALRALVRTISPDTLPSLLGIGAEELADLLPELRQRLADPLRLTEREPEGARFRLFEAVSSLLVGAAEQKPIVILLDDLHAADEPSLLMLRFLARELAQARVFVLVAYRDVDPTPTDPLTVAVTELLREPVTRRLDLSGLGKQDVARLIELVSGEQPTEDLVSTIHEETDGNPLFVGEIVRLIAAEGGWDTAGSSRLVLPQSVRDVIRRRLRHLADDCNRVLLLASVLGREFSLDALARMAEVSVNTLLGTLDEAMAARIVSDVPGSVTRARFDHVVIRDTLYDGLTTARRVRMHQLAVAALEASYGEQPGAHLAELAHHSIAGSDFERGLSYAQRAGDWALDLFAYEEAVHLYETALDVLDLAGASEHKHCDLLLSAGDAEARAGNRAGAKQFFMDATMIARQVPLPRELGRAALGYGGPKFWVRAGSDEKLVPLLGEAIRVLGDAEPELRARLLARLAGALRDEYSRERRDNLSREAVELARRTNDPIALADALDGRAAAIIAPDTVRECLSLGNEMFEIAQQTRNHERLIAAVDIRAVSHVMLGEIDQALADLEAATEAANQLRQPALLWDVCGDQAMLALATGRLAEGEELMNRAFRYGERAQPDISHGAYQLQRYTLSDFRSGLEDVEPMIRVVADEHPNRPVFRCVLAHLLARLERRAEADQALGALARDDFKALPFDQEWLYGMSLLAETVTLLGDAESATVIYGLLLPWAEFNAADLAEGMRGSISRYLALLAAMLEQWDDAASHFNDALEMNERMGALPWLAYTKEDYARFLLKRGDSANANHLLDEALSTYRDLAMEGALVRAEVLSNT